MLELIYTSTKTLSGLAGPRLAYLAYWDALLLVNAGSLYKLSQDGSAVYLGVAPVNGNPGNLAPDQLYWNFAPLLYGADPLTAQPAEGVLNQAWPTGWFNSAGDLLDLAAGVQVHPTGNGAAVVAALADGALLRTLTDPAALPLHNLLPAAPGRLLALSHSSGRVACFNYLSGTMLWGNYLRPCLASAYDGQHGLLITLESDGKLRLYTLNAVAADLSDPTFSPAAAPLLAYKGYQVEVQLTDAGGQPLADQLINWSLLGMPPKGWLRWVQSRTGTDGTARNYYYTPREDQLGAEILQAQAVL